jgi:hypothetical protein
MQLLVSEERDLDLLHHCKSARLNENTGRCNISVELVYARVVKFVRSPSEDGWRQAKLGVVFQGTGLSANWLPLFVYEWPRINHE